MNWRRKLLILQLLLLAFTCLEGQDSALSNLLWKKVAVDSSKQFLDSLPIYEGSILFFENLEGDALEVDYQLTDNFLLFTNPSAVQSDSLWISFRTLPSAWMEPTLRIDSQDIISGAEEQILVYDPFETPEGSILDLQGMNYRGNFTRGLSFGNNQNLVLNSSFNLQMAGIIGDGIEVSAAISDENIPIQPEGTTQQLNEFDRVFIQLRKDSTTLIAGDYDLLRPDGYFMNHYKRLQGLNLETADINLAGGQLSLRGNMAISRGKFSRMSFQGQEGNQGPYRLMGNEGETFIIVLAGTERIFIDGQLMERGLDRDYIINYNSGEVTFMPRRLITKDLRIIIEFEYSDQNYLRWLYAAGAEYQKGNTRLYLNSYSEQDSRSTIGNAELTPMEREALRLAGDNPTSAVSSGIDSLTENTIDPITYRLVDTLVNGFLYSDILVYSPDTSAENQLYTARFSDLGEGNGNYIRPSSDANGIVYVWVAPDEAGNPQGRYDPVIRLVPPKQLQLFTAGAEHQFSQRATLRGEVALSQRNNNRFSDIDSGDDIGLATYLSYNQKIPLGTRWALNSELSHEALHQNFRPLNPYRPPEFNRDWNISQTSTSPEHWARANFRVSHDSLPLQLEYNFNGFWQGGFYNGQRHIGHLVAREKGWFIDLTGNLLDASSELETSRFWRPRATLERNFSKLGNWTLGAFYESEQNARNDVLTDTLLVSSFNFSVYRAYISSPENENFSSEISFQFRTDDQAESTGFQRFSEAWDTRLNGHWSSLKSLRLGWQMHFRRLFLTEPPEGQSARGDTYSGQTDLALTLFKEAVRYTADYRLTSGQEQKILFVFQPVNPGEGVYKHIDFNGDGIEQNDEFVIAPNQDETTHVRVIVYANEFIRTNNAQLFQTLLFDPRKWWFNSSGLKGVIGKFSSQTSWQTNQKVRQLPGISGWNPFQFELADTSLVSSLSNLRQNVFFNQLDPVYGLQYSYTDNQNKTLLTTGFQARRRLEHLFQFRWNIGQAHSIRIQYANGKDNNLQESNANQNFEIDFLRVEPEWSFQPNNDFRTILSYRYETGSDQLPGSDVRALFHEGKLEVRYNQTSKTFISTAFSFVKVDFNGNPDSAVGFALLDGLLNGNNFRWNLSVDRQLAQNLRLNLSYEGRKTGSARVVHTGRAQVSAVF